MRGEERRKGYVGREERYREERVKEARVNRGARRYKRMREERGGKRK